MSMALSISGFETISDHTLHIELVAFRAPGLPAACGEECDIGGDDGCANWVAALIQDQPRIALARAPQRQPDAVVVRDEQPDDRRIDLRHAPTCFGCVEPPRFG